VTRNRKLTALRPYNQIENTFSMTDMRSTSSPASRPKRKLSLSVGDVLFDLKGHAYRVVSRDETPEPADTRPRADLCIVAIDDEHEHKPAGLTPRQLEIARLLASRATNAEIATSLGISVHTARHHSQKVLEKLGITSRADVRKRFERPRREYGNTGHPRRDPR
jgi:DNA-binding CsgD family transcriptional regulator